MQPRNHFAVACLIALACQPLCGQARHTPEQRFKMFQDYLARRGEEVTRNNLADIENLDAWKHKRPEVRRRFLYTLGLDPMPAKTPLHARTTGELQRDGYRVENVVFESMPGLYVTANLFLP